MKKRYARILAATLSAAMVFTSAPASVFDTGVIEAEAAVTSGLAAPSSTISLGRTSFTTSYSSSKSTIAEYAEVPAASGDVTYTAIGTTAVPSTGISATAVSIYGVIDGSKASDTEVSGKYFKDDLEANGWTKATDNTITTSGSYYTTTPATQTITVTANDALPSDADALFPKTIVTKYKSNELTYAMTAGGTPSSATVTNVETALKTGDVSEAKITGAYDIRTMNVGETKTVTITLTMKTLAGGASMDWTSFVDKDMKIFKEYTVACVKTDDVDANPETELGSLPTSVTAEYGTGKVTLNSETYWKVVDGSVKAEVATADNAAVVTKGVKVASVAKYDSASYDIDAILKLNNWKNGGYTYNSATQSFEKYVDVTVGKAKVYASKLNSWPSALVKGATIEIGSDVTALELVGKDAKEGTYTVTGITNYDYTLATPSRSVATTANKIGKQYLTVQFAEGTNYDVVENDSANKNKDITDSVTGKIVYSDLIEVNVVKKTVTEADCQPKMKKTSVEYGATFDDILKSCVNANEYVRYTLRDEDADKVATIGSHRIALDAKLIAPATYQIGAGKDKTIVYVNVEVKAPETAAYLNTSDVANLASAYTPQASIGNPASATDVFVNSKVGTYLDSLAAANYDIKCQLYANGAKLGSAKTYTQDGNTGNKFTIAKPTENGVTEYYAVITYTAKTTATDEAKAALAAVLPTGTLTTQKFTITQSTITTTANSVVAVDYGYTDTLKSKATVSYSDPAVAGWSFKDCKVVLKDAKGADVATITNVTKATAANVVTLEAILPSGLNAGTYSVLYEVNSVKTDGTTDVSVASATITVNKADITIGAADLKTEKTSYAYGTKLSDIKLISAKEGCTVAWSTENPEYPTVLNGAANAKLNIVITQTEEQKKNYTVNASSVTQYTIPATALITKAKLEITVDPIELKVGDKLPAIATVKPSVKGIVAKDKFSDLATVELKYAAGLENSIAKAGTYVDAVEVTAKTGGVAIDNSSNPLANYTVKVTDGTVVVTDGSKPTTPPTVAPTPAPAVKVPAAKKVTNSVKRGKQVALKLSNAKGAKVTWRVESKAKKALKVSKKGKVTVLKTAKKGKTYKVFAYVKLNGKTTKVTFKIKVK